MSSHSNSTGGVEFRNVSRRYGAVTAVNEISFTVEPGTLVTLLGPSGCGKTTTLRMIAGLEMASSGTIRIGGKDVTNIPATDRDVTMVFQSYALFPHMSVLDNVAFGLAMEGMARKTREDRAREGLATVGLSGYEARLPSELSGGQQQRVAVARALVLEPEVLLFDEPLSNLDAKLRRRMRDDIRDLQQKLGLTSVYVTHDQEEALAVSDKIIVMNRSVIAQHGTPAELYTQPASRFVADFMGIANLIDAEVVGKGSGGIDLSFGGARMTVAQQYPKEAGRLTMAIRPQAIRLVTEAAPWRLPVSVSKAAYLGSHMEFRLASDAGELLAIQSAELPAIAVGASAFAEISPAGVALVPSEG